MKKLKTKWTVTFQNCQGLQLWNFHELSPLEYKLVTNSKHYQSKMGTLVSLYQVHSSSMKPLSVTTEENNKQNHPSNSNLIMFQSPKFSMPICTWSPTNFGESKSCLMVNRNFFLPTNVRQRRNSHCPDVLVQTNICTPFHYINNDTDLYFM